MKWHPMEQKLMLIMKNVVLPDFILSTDKDENNGICIKWYNTVEKIFKIRPCIICSSGMYIWYGRDFP